MKSEFVGLMHPKGARSSVRISTIAAISTGRAGTEVQSRVLLLDGTSIDTVESLASLRRRIFIKQSLPNLAWFGFWVFLAVFIACDSWVFSQGYESALQGHVTPEEKQIQQIKIERLRKGLD